MIDLPHSLLGILAGLLPLAYWMVLLIVVLVGVSFAAAGARRPTTGVVIAMGSCLAVGLALASVTAPTPGIDSAIPAILVGASSLAFSVLGGSAASQWVLNHTSGGEQRGPRGGIVVASREPDRDAKPIEVLRGGMVIGYLERLATTGAIIAGFPEAIAVVVAVKGVGRFTELGESETRERFIIGSLVSLIWASACGALFHFAAR